jgi:hypothetical protein
MTDSKPSRFVIAPALLCCSLLLVGLNSASADPAAIKAKVAEPVVEELMGGCSMKCAFDWTAQITTPGGKPESTHKLDDDSALTTWASENPKIGPGVKVRLTFPKARKTQDPETPLFGLDLVNGYWKDEALFAKYARVKRARLYYNDKPYRDLLFSDSRRWHRVEFPDIFVEPGDTMTFEVLEVYPGKAAGLAITELVLQGAH